MRQERPSAAPLASLALSMVAAVALAACDQAAEEGSGGMMAQVRAQCIAQVNGLPIAAEAADTVCDCTARRAQDELDIGGLISGDTTQIETIVAQCAQQYLSGGADGERTDEAEAQ